MSMKTDYTEMQLETNPVILEAMIREVEQEKERDIIDEEASA